MRGSLAIALAFAALSSIALVGGAPARAAGDDDDIDVAGLDAPELRGDALVWEDGTFFLEPWEGGASVRLSTFSRGRREEVGRAIPVRIVASTRTFVEVELPRAPGCATRRLELDARVEALRLFVKRADLAPVLVKPYQVTFSDGTGVRIAAGVPVMPTASGLYALSVRGDRLRLPIPHAHVGYVYTPGKVTEPDKPSGALVRVDRMAPVRLGGEPFEVRAAWIASKPAKDGEPQLVRWQTRCMELTVAVPAVALRPATWAPPYRPYESSMPMAKLSHRLLRGTPLATPSGREVAVAADGIDVEVSGADEPRACFDARLAMLRLEDPPQSSLTRTLRLCASSAHIAGEPPPPAVKSLSFRLAGAAPPDVGGPPPDAKRTPKGTWYRVLAPGKGGRSPTRDDKVKVHYTGWTTDGKQIDSSATLGVPAVFPLAGVIEGWTDALQLMTVGMKLRVWIPEELAYKGGPGRPAGMLVFDIELLAIQ